MLWYLLVEIAVFFGILCVFRGTAIKILKSSKYWKIVGVWTVFILAIIDPLAYILRTWSFPGTYLFGTVPFGYPVFEEFFFVMLLTWGVLCTWNVL